MRAREKTTSARGPSATETDAGKRARLLGCVYMGLFGLSGLAGLIYEVAWVRQFTLVLGASTYAVTIVLAVFMAGLGLGAWLFGKMADRFDEKGLARCYLLLELGIGIYGLILPVLLGGAEQLYTAFYRHYQPGLAAATAIRLVVAFSLLILPTTFMGATFPILSRYLTRAACRISVTVSWLYGLNTIGALAGAALAGYVLLPTLGIALTTATAVALNFLVAAAFWIAHTVANRTELVKSLTQALGGVKVQPFAEPAASRPEKVVVLAFAISGFAAMLYEVAWTRTLTMILGTTTFAFTTMLTTFLLGIALGSLSFGFLRKLASPASLLVWLQYVVAFSVILTIPLFEKIPFLYLSLRQIMPAGWLSVQLARFLLVAVVMIPPTFALGSIFPAVTAIFVERTEIMGRRLGWAYGLNTVGGVLGASLAGLLLIPIIGMQKTIVLGALLNLAAGSLVMLLWMDRPPRSRVLHVCGASAALLSLLLFVSPWSPRVLNSGVYVYADRYQAIIDRVESAFEGELRLSKADAWSLWDLAFNQYELLYYRPGVTATVAVMQRSDGVRFLTIDGKTDASTANEHDMKTQVMLGQLPLLFHHRPDKVFVVGFGSGVTVGSVLTHDARVVDCAELSPAVIEASAFFSEVNHSPLCDPRLRLIRRDARNVLLTSADRYDVVISQPSNPWISGQSSLFSLEWYQLVEESLEDKGFLVQWLPAYCTSEEDVKVMMHTMRTVFPHTTVWTSGAGGDLILLAQKGESLQIDYELLLARAARPAVREDLLRVDCSPDLVPFQTFVMNAEEVGVFLYSDLASPLRRNTDDLPITEFSGPKHMVGNRIARRFAASEGLCGDATSLMKILCRVDAETMLEVLRACRQAAEHDPAPPDHPARATSAEPT